MSAALKLLDALWAWPAKGEVNDTAPAAADAGDAVAEAFADAVTGALAQEGEIRPARDWAEEQLAQAVKREQALQTQLAAANAAHDAIVAQAGKDRDAIVEDVTAKLKRTTSFRAALTMFKGELVKAEL